LEINSDEFDMLRVRIVSVPELTVVAPSHKDPDLDSTDSEHFFESELRV
jgi:hypothetical protein